MTDLWFKGAFHETNPSLSDCLAVKITGRWDAAATSASESAIRVAILKPICAKEVIYEYFYRGRYIDAWYSVYKNTRGCCSYHFVFILRVVAVGEVWWNGDEQAVVY